MVTSLYAADILGISTAWLLGINKKIIIYHDTHKMFVLRQILRKVLALNLADKIIAGSLNVENFLINFWKIANKKIVVIFNGIDFQLDIKNVSQRYSEILN
ncbi:MAG: hypothetical protein PHO28_02835 [Candidatus Pacebacteria bacterium]|nr:hypothetical protein [Candidatus Paceibacterota bacterium]